MSYNLGNRGYRSDFHGDESFANQYFDLIEEAFGDPDSLVVDKLTLFIKGLDLWINLQ